MIQNTIGHCVVASTGGVSFFGSSLVMSLSQDSFGSFPLMSSSFCFVSVWIGIVVYAIFFISNFLLL